MITIHKRFVTLIEMIIVMVLIGLILGVVAYNYSGTLDEGRAFKTKTAIEKLETILNLYVAEHPDAISTISTDWQAIVISSPLVQNPASLTTDGWGNTYHVEYKDGEVVVTSQRFDDYVKSHPGTMFRK